MRIGSLIIARASNGAALLSWHPRWSLTWRWTFSALRCPEGFGAGWLPCCRIWRGIGGRWCGSLGFGRWHIEFRQQRTIRMVGLRFVSGGRLFNLGTRSVEEILADEQAREP
jgi:hypothetical protein